MTKNQGTSNMWRGKGSQYEGSYQYIGSYQPKDWGTGERTPHPGGESTR